MRIKRKLEWSQTESTNFLVWQQNTKYDNAGKKKKKLTLVRSGIPGLGAEGTKLPPTPKPVNWLPPEPKPLPTLIAFTK